MFQRIIKRSQRKLGKSDPNLTSNVVVNHASRITVTNSTVSSTSDTQPVSSSPRTPTTNVVIEMLPPLRDAVVSDRPSLFLRKIVLCSSLCDFSDSLKSVREKEIKRQTLHELIDFLHSNPSFKLNDLTQSSLIQMISLNIFRCLPPSSHEHSTSSSSSDFASPEDEDDPYLEPSWPHLQLVYELLLRYIVSPDTDIKVAKRHVDNVFVLKILELFDSEDPREREYLKTILHRIYGKFMVHRPFIRKAINNVFYTFIFETQRHSGISELLEILGSIINGFALPMKEEHKLFLVRALIPLHKAKGVAAYHQQLAYCVVQFVERDCKLADNVIRGLLKYWPLTNCSKEVLFLGEMEEVLETTQAAEFQSCMVPLFRQLGRCLNSPHFQVAERTLYFWNSDHILSLIAQNRNVIFPIIFEALEKNMQGHWNRGVHGLTANVLKMFQEMDAELYEECQRQYSEKEARASELEEQRQLTWKRLEAAAAQDGGEDMVLVN